MRFTAPLADVAHLFGRRASRPRQARCTLKGAACSALPDPAVPGVGGGGDAVAVDHRQALQAVLDKSVSDYQAPFMVGMTVNAAGVTFTGSAGQASAGLKAGADTVFRIFSMSKAIGTTAAMILIDRGQLSMDTPVESVLPDFAGVRVLAGYDAAGKAIFKAPSVKATVRHLATHTSGIEYEFWCKDEADYLQRTGGAGVLGATNLLTALLNDYPMITHPGTRWGYGPSIDWLGLVVEKVSGQDIMGFLRTNLFDPLGMKDTEATVRADMKARLASVSFRGADAAFSPFPVEPPVTADTWGMGHALYSTPNDYARFLRMVLNKGSLDGQRVLSEAAVANMLQNQMPTGLTFQPLDSVSPLSASFNPFPGIAKSHGFGFLRVDEDVLGMRRAGSVAWAGVCNSHYWIDPSSDIAGLFMTQTLPFGEAPYMAAYEAFERAAHAR